MSNAARNFDILATSLSILHNYFDSSIKLFSDLSLAKLLDALAKIVLFPCYYYIPITIKIRINIRNIIILIYQY